MEGKKINIIQFLPYFPPHKGGLETVAEEIGIYWTKQKIGKCINLTTNFNQEKELENNEKIVFFDEIIGYKKNGVEILVVPSFEIINSFPVYKIWSKKYKIIKKYLKKEFQESKKNTRIITHTRFFLTSFIAGKFAKKENFKWIHIEHGSDYVKLSSKIKTKVAYFYDKIIGKKIFRKADKILAISEACKKFINGKFTKREVNVFYRGLELPKEILLKEDLKEKFPNKIIIGYVGRLYKWKNVSSLIKAYYGFDNIFKKKIQIVIVGDGEDFEKFKKMDVEKEIYFTGGQSFADALSYQKQFDIHIHPSSPGGGLATTLLQAMNFGCLIIATPNEGAKEIIKNGENGILLKNDSVLEIKKGIKLALEKFSKKDEFTKESKKILEEKFSWDKNILKLYNFLK